MPIFSSVNGFRGQQPDENVVLVVRRHWIKLFSPLFVMAVFGVLPFVFYFLLEVKNWDETYTALYRFGTAVYFLVLWNLAFYNIMIYILNTVVVTNKRVIENEQRGFFRYNLNELNLYNIQDISIKISGIWSTFLDYGDIEIETAGAEQDKFYFNSLPHPKEVKKMIMSQVTRFHQPPPHP